MHGRGRTQLSIGHLTLRTATCATRSCSEWPQSVWKSDEDLTFYLTSRATNRTSSLSVLRRIKYRIAGAARASVVRGS